LRRHRRPRHRRLLYREVAVEAAVKFNSEFCLALAVGFGRFPLRCIRLLLRNCSRLEDDLRKRLLLGVRDA